MPPTLQWSAHTDRGKIRSNNEDSFLGLRFNASEVQYLGKIGEASLEQTDFTFAVSDGIGGAKAGEFASRTAVDKITRLLPRAYRQTATGIAAGMEDVLGELYDQIHRALMYLGSSYPECAGMGATLTLCWFTPDRLHWAHIGDSRLYYLPVHGGGIRQVSHDDTHVGWLFRQQKINEREARSHPRRNLLQRALGAGHQFVEPQVGTILFEPGDQFLLCSDGVTDGSYDYQLLEELRLEQADTAWNPAPGLVAAAVDRSGRDNTTALVVRVV